MKAVSFSNGARLAFTLSELLLIIMVVAALAAVLFPVFARARDAKAGSCLSNRRLTNQAIILYSQDYDGLIAPDSRLSTYRPFVRTNGFSTCPTFGAVGIPMHCEAKPVGQFGVGGGDEDRGEAGGGRGHGTRSPNLIYHGGPIMPFSHTYAIFWGTSWPGHTGDKISGMDSFYAGYGGTSYANTNTEYYQSNGTFVGTSSTYGGHDIDGSSAPSSAPSVSTILNEVCSRVGNNVDMTGQGYYAVYSDQGRGGAGYCAWHSYGSCNGVPVQIGFFFNLDGDAGCNPQSSVPGQSQGLQAIANVSGHELSEAVTDPKLNAWYDAQGAENSDKCAWTFGAPFVTFSNGSQWKIQGNWSNAAYNANTGYALRGCIQTK